MIRLVASDLDGTIINAQNACDPSTAEAVDYLHSMQVKFAVCSGRPADSIIPLFKGWGLEGKVDYVIGTGGGEVIDVSRNKRTEAYAMPVDLIKEIMDLYEPLGIVPTVQDGMHVYVSRMDEDVKAYEKQAGVVCEVTDDIRAKILHPRIKEMFIVHPADMPFIEKFAADHPDPRYAAFKTGDNLFEMNHPLLAKDVGLRIVGSILHITSQEMMAFGDTTNDIKMLKYVKYGICIGSGTDDARKAACDIAPSLEKKGFAAYIYAHIRNGEYVK